MDDTILTLDQNIVFPDIPVGDRDSYRIRQAARAVVLDSSGAIALLNAGERDYYKLPGGGIDEGEYIQNALARELMEEIGSKAQVIESLGTVVEWKDNERLKQISYCFMAILDGDKGNPNFTEKEKAEGFSVVWAANINEAIQLVSANVDSNDTEVAFMTRRDTAFLQKALAVKRLML